MQRRDIRARVMGSGKGGGGGSGGGGPSMLRGGIDGGVSAGQVRR